MWNRDEAKGRLDHERGRADEALGDLRGKDAQRERGAKEDNEGQAREAWGQARRQVGEAVHDVSDQLKK